MIIGLAMQFNKDYPDVRQSFTMLNLSMPELNPDAIDLSVNGRPINNNSLVIQASSSYFCLAGLDKNDPGCTTYPCPIKSLEQAIANNVTTLYLSDEPEEAKEWDESQLGSHARPKM